MKPDRNAAVAVIHAGEVILRPGLFVFSTPDGFAWVEPSYRELVPSRPALYRVRGVLTLTAAGFSCEGDDGRTYMVGAIDAMEDGTGEDLRQACAWAAADIAASGSSMDAERDRLRAIVEDADA